MLSLMSCTFGATPQIVKKNLVENIIPIIIGLKNALERKQSPLQKNLMAYLREVMRDFKEEVNGEFGVLSVSL